MTQHSAEEPKLYALGLTIRSVRHPIEEHCAIWRGVRTLVIAAEATAAALAAALPRPGAHLGRPQVDQRARPRRRRLCIAVTSGSKGRPCNSAYAAVGAHRCGH